MKTEQIILRTDQFRDQEQDEDEAIGSKVSAQNTMIIISFTTFGMGGALWTLNFSRGMKLWSIQLDENASDKTNKNIKSLIYQYLSKYIIEGWIRLLAVPAVQGVTDVMVSRNAAHSEQRLRGVTLCAS